MARKSGWQEFAENFKSSYKMVNDVKQQYATNQIMKDKIEENEAGKYTYMGEEYGTENEALSKQYGRLADVATRFGDTDKGLGYRKQITDIEANRIQADIARATKQDQIALQGQLAVLMAQANIGNKNADTARLGSITGLNNQSLSEKKRTFDTRLRSLVAKAGLDESNATIAEVKAAIAKGTQDEEQTALLAEIEKRRIVAESDGNKYETVADLNIDKLKADIASTEEGVKVKTAQTGSLEAGTKQTEALTAKQVFENARQESFKLKDYAAYGASLDADLEAANARGDQSSLAALTAQRAELREMALMDFHTFVPETDEETYGTADDQRYDQWLNMIKTFDGPEAALAWQNKHSAGVTGQILADSNRLVAEVQAHLSTGGKGLKGVAQLMDDINGDGGGADVVTLGDGRRALVETDANGATTRIIAAAENETELSALVQTMTKPEAAINVAERLYQTKKRGLDTRVTEQAIETDASVEGTNKARTKLINAQVKNLPEELKLTKAQASLATAKADEIVKSMEGLQPGPKQKIIIEESLEAVAKFIIAGYEGEDLDEAVAAYMRNRGSATSGDGFSIEPAN